MGRFYGNRIKAGIMTLEEVPGLWKTQTEEWLNENS